MVTGIGNDMEASAEAMTMEQMIAMKEGLEAQIKAMSKPTTDKVNSVGRFTAAANISGIDEEDPPPRRLNVGQMYQVIAKFVAVRSGPSLEAPFLRRLNQGAKVEMFEWDSSRRWRRISVECAAVMEGKPKPRLSEAQRRWATEAPHWDNAKGCWVDKSKKVEVVDDAEDLVVQKDGWVLVQHPDMGLLLQALGEGDALVEEVVPVRSEGAPQERSVAAPVVVQPTTKEETFDYYWGTSSKKPVTFQATPAPPAVAQSPVIGESSFGDSQPQKPSVLGESSIAEAMLSAVGGALNEDSNDHAAEVPNVNHPKIEATRYRVVYKKVAVRKEPNTKSEALRQLPQGEIVEMYEWDETHCWRRIRILAIREAAEGGGMQETDGWMLIESPSVGRLLEEVAGDDNDDDFAG